MKQCHFNVHALPFIPGANRKNLCVPTAFYPIKQKRKDSSSSIEGCDFAINIPLDLELDIRNRESLKQDLIWYSKASLLVHQLHVKSPPLAKMEVVPGYSPHPLLQHNALQTEPETDFTAETAQRIKLSVEELFRAAEQFEKSLERSNEKTELD